MFIVTKPLCGKGESPLSLTFGDGLSNIWGGLAILFGMGGDTFRVLQLLRFGWGGSTGITPCRKALF